MSTRIVMPQLGESVAEGIIGKWLKQEGDSIEKDEPIVEVITDKVNAEIPSPVGGVLERITQPEGATVLVGAEIAVIGDGSAQAEESQNGSAQQTQPAQPVPTAGASSQPQPVSSTAAPSNGAPVSTPAPPSSQSSMAETYAPAGGSHESGGRGDRVRSSPLVRRLADEHGIDLAAVPGTGIGGRVSKQDILLYVESREAQQQQAAGVQSSVATAEPEEDERMPAMPPIPQPPTIPHPTVAEPPQRAPQPASPAPTSPAAAQNGREAADNEELLPVSPLRKMIAQRMVQSKFTLPHATTMMEVDMSSVVRFREANKDVFRQREGIALSYVAFVIKATVEALKEFPIVNAEWAGDNIILKRDININVAVDAPEGLTTPVIHHADEKSLAGLSKAIVDLAQRARNKKLTMNDMQGGTFTVNNTGSLGSVASVSIINYPQAGILTANAIVKRPVVVEQDGQDLIAVRSMMNLSFSFDHRVLDGGTATGFVGRVKQKLETWSQDYPLY